MIHTRAVFTYMYVYVFIYLLICVRTYYVIGVLHVTENYIYMYLNFVRHVLHKSVHDTFVSKVCNTR